LPQVCLTIFLTCHHYTFPVGTPAGLLKAVRPGNLIFSVFPFINTLDDQNAVALLIDIEGIALAVGTPGTGALMTLNWSMWLSPSVLDTFLIILPVLASARNKSVVNRFCSDRKITYFPLGLSTGQTFMAPALCHPAVSCREDLLSFGYPSAVVVLQGFLPRG
jgi:hypothetical protein